VEADAGCGGAERDAAVRPDRGVPLLHDQPDLAARKQRPASELVMSRELPGPGDLPDRGHHAAETALVARGAVEILSTLSCPTPAGTRTGPASVRRLPAAFEGLSSLDHSRIVRRVNLGLPSPGRTRVSCNCIGPVIRGGVRMRPKLRRLGTRKG